MAEDKELLERALKALEAGPHANLVMNYWGLVDKIRARLARPEAAAEPLVYKIKKEEHGCGLKSHITAREYSDKTFEIQGCYEFIGLVSVANSEPGPSTDDAKDAARYRWLFNDVDLAAIKRSVENNVSPPHNLHCRIVQEIIGNYMEKTGADLMIDDAMQFEAMERGGAV